MGPKRTFYRAVSTAERDDALACDCLRAGGDTEVDGKWLWATADAARAFARQLRDKGLPASDHVLEVTFEVDVLDRLFDLGPNLDGCGQGYYAEPEALQFAMTIRELSA